MLDYLLGAKVISTKWIEKRKPSWAALEKLLQRVNESGLKSLNRSELQKLGLLYRQIAADLASTREDPSSIEFARYLNQLLARAHNFLYSRQKPRGKTILTFFLETYPQIFRKNLIYFLISFAVFIAGAAAGAVCTLRSDDFKRSIIGDEMMDSIERHEMWTHSIVGIKPLASSAIMTNNMAVSFAAFATGLTAGIGTLYVMFFNGLLIGVIGAACWSSGMSLKLWSFISPHGALELPAIFIAGAAGLKIASGFLFPGSLPRKESLTAAGKEGVHLIIGVIPILIIAGLIEAFISPTPLAVSLKFATGACLFALLFAYLLVKRK